MKIIISCNKVGLRMNFSTQSKVEILLTHARVSIYTEIFSHRSFAGSNGNPPTCIGSQFHESDLVGRLSSECQTCETCRACDLHRTILPHRIAHPPDMSDTYLIVDQRQSNSSHCDTIRFGGRPEATNFASSE